MVVIKSFKDRRTESLDAGMLPKGIPADVAVRAIKKLVMIRNAFAVEDLRIPPGNRLHQLTGDRAGQWSVSVNDQWRVCFVWKDGDAFEVEFCDYH